MSSITSNSSPLILSTPILKSKCYQYAEDVANGNIIASRKNIKAAKRFINDLENQKYQDYPWKFDLERAYRPIEFMEKFQKPMKGDYDKMVLLPWQHFCEGNLYGWVDKETELRRFREGLIVVARGNGKSTMISGNAEYAASKDGEKGADVYLLANAKEQSAIIFDECSENIKSSLILSKKFRVTKHVIFYDKTHSKIQHRASDSRKLDGLNTHLGIFDEIHEFRNFKLINVIKRSTNKRRQPLVIYITTLGNILDGPLMQLYVMADGVLDGTIDQEVSDRIFCYVAEIDEDDKPDNVECWVKANPSLGKLLKIEDLIIDWKRSKLNPEERNDFINKQLNVFTSIDEMSFLDYEIIKRNKKSIDIKQLEGKICYGGFDLSNTEDFTSADLEFPLENGNSFFLSHSWIPEKKVELDQEKIPYHEWEKQGLLTIVKGEYVRKELVFQWFAENSKCYQIDSVGYDPANAPWLVQALENAGIRTNVVRQGFLTLNAPLKDLKELFIDGKIITNSDPLLWWYINNVKLLKDRNGNYMPSKMNRFRKIDGFAAMLNSHSECMRLNPTTIEEDTDLVTVIDLN